MENQRLGLDLSLALSYYRYELRVAQLKKGLMKKLDHPHRTFKFQAGTRCPHLLCSDSYMYRYSYCHGKPWIPCSFVKLPRLSHTL
jgi:hypothetical protein